MLKLYSAWFWTWQGGFWFWRKAALKMQLILVGRMLYFGRHVLEEARKVSLRDKFVVMSFELFFWSVILILSSVRHCWGSWRFCGMGSSTFSMGIWWPCWEFAILPSLIEVYVFIFLWGSVISWFYFISHYYILEGFIGSLCKYFERLKVGLWIWE